MNDVGVLVMAYGGPDTLDDVEPYLLDVRGGRPTSAAIVEEVRERYRRIGGRSPIRERTEAQAAALESALNAGGAGDGSRGTVRFRTYVGMRHWLPTIRETLGRMSEEGVRRAVGLVMTPHFSRLSVGAYQARAAEAGAPVELAHIDDWHLLPGYLDALERLVRDALGRFPADERPGVPVIFTAHSLPRRILEWNDPYPRQLEATASALARRLGGSLAPMPDARPTAEPDPPAGARPQAFPPGRESRFEFAYQSAAMTPDPWLGPDAGEVIGRLARQGKRSVLIVPIGFVCEHVEILYDVDIVFHEQARRAGLRLERIEMLNTAPSLIQGLAQRVRERTRESGWL
jgi:ferrochelatase